MVQYGHFDDAAREYVIDTPATPLPWINYLGNEAFFSLISNTAGGYSFYKDAKLRRITRYRYNNVPQDEGARNYYLSLMSDASAEATPVDSWSPTFLPMKTPLDSYRCRHGLGYTVIEASRKGIESEFTAFVPMGAHAEINMLTVRNTTEKPVVIDVTGSVEWCLWNAVDDSTNFQRNLSTGEVEVEQMADATLLYHKTEFKERRNHYAFFSVNEPTIGFDTARDIFLGRFNGWDSPDAITQGHAFNSIAYGWYPMAAARVRLQLDPGDARTLVFMTGYVEVPQDQKWEDASDPAKVGIINKQPAHELFARFNTMEKVEAALQELKQYWDGLLSGWQVTSGDERLDRMVNIWNQYQCMVTFNMSRSASYYESGTGRGMGFRDSNQDLLGFVHIVPARARERILDIAATQLPDGSAWHQYQPLTKLGNADIGGGFNDDPLWLVASVFAYICETGDAAILAEPVPFNNEDGSEQPLLEHLRRSVRFTMSHRGPHGLPLIGRADWNDCLNLNCFSATPGESFQTVENNDTGIAESVFIAGMFVLYGEQYAQLLEHCGASQCGMTDVSVETEVHNVRKAVAEVREAAQTAGWDGDWFVRAYDAHGNKVGTAADTEGRIFIEPQGLCVMAGIGTDNGKAQRALESTKQLLTGRWGTAILAPAYSTYRIELGEISTYPRGYKENGGIFCHNNPWISIANALVGNDDEAFAIYERTCPSYVEPYSDIHMTEPYVYCQMVAGPESPTPGQGKNSWLTGTAAWTFVNVSQYLLGVKPTLDGLLVEPHMPERFTEFTITRRWRGTEYVIHVKHTGERSMLINGQAAEGFIVPQAAAGVNHVQVDVTF
ncbi:glycosyl transferase [Bifidobacterium dolichotidis]|uniref:Glycosyl transferase n=1 Tax=Bifidobacterium dolichotidis TaxID=2306976 RepID=A0A430FQV2_9BIFI|nr:glycosyl transferase [Bifidobacterium dolichotidis]RSX55195.1 glycosyl transferase [Bifidobacterium dolichotidis]